MPVSRRALRRMRGGEGGAVRLHWRPASMGAEKWGDRSRRSPLPISLGQVLQATHAAALPRRRAAKPNPRKPPTTMSQVDGSGMALVLVVTAARKGSP